MSGRRMGKIVNLKPQFSTLRSRVVIPRDDHGHSRTAEPWRRWYSLKAWSDLRERVFVRDLFICRCGCGTFIADPAERIADHIEPHRGDRRLFFDERNVQTLWKPHHDGWKQRLERGHRL